MITNSTENGGTAKPIQSFTNGTEPDGAMDSDWTASSNGSEATASGHTFDLLAIMNVSINAEITVASPTDPSYRGFTLYDLW